MTAGGYQLIRGFFMPNRIETGNTELDGAALVIADLCFLVLRVGRTRHNAMDKSSLTMVENNKNKNIPRKS